MYTLFILQHSMQVYTGNTLCSTADIQWATWRRSLLYDVNLFSHYNTMFGLEKKVEGKKVIREGWVALQKYYFCITNFIFIDIVDFLLTNFKN